MSRKILAGFVAVVLVLAGCQGETVGPNSNPDGTQPPGIGGPQPTHIGDANLAAAIEADLTCLYQKAGLLPNESSSLGKFATIKSLLAADDIQGALDATANLIRFIELKWSQYKGAGTVDCGDGKGPVSVEALKNQVILRLNVYVTTEGAVCEIPGGSVGGTFCQSTDDSAFVYFPAPFLNLTYVSVQKDPPGLTKLQNTFDEYPTYIRILTTDPSLTFSGSNKPLVVVCFNDQVAANEPSLLARLLLGKLHTNPTTGATTFTALPKPDYSAYPDALASAKSLCGAPPDPSAFGISNRTVLGRFMNKVLTTILPQAVQAQFGFDEMAFGGVGGSPEEFSDFGAIDPGMAFGGVGGSPEEFAPPAAAPGAPAMLPAAPPSDALIGLVSSGDSASTWATVTVKTGLGTPIAGAAVTFSLTDPSLTGDYGADPSAATFCDASTTLTVATDATGAAKVTCIRFGLTVGFKNLNATLDPTSIDPSACVIGAAGLCVSPSAADINYLVATVPGEPAQLSITTAPGATSAVAGAAMNAQPVIQVQDAGGNPVGPTPGLSVTATVSTGGTLGGTTSVTTDGEGVATFTNLTLGGLVGTSYTLTFSTGALTAATANVTVSGPGPAASLSVAPGTTTAAAGATIPTLTATVRDAFTNPVAGVSVGASATGLACASGCPGTTDASGNAAFSTLSIGGTVGDHVVTFSATGLADATVTVTLTPGPAASIAVVPPPTGGDYGTGLAPFANASPNPTVSVTDTWNNQVTGATVVWQRTGDLTNGSAVTPNGYSATWKLGDGGNGLTASTGSLAPATFTAVTTTGGILNACAASGSLKKSDVGEYDAATGTFTGRFSIVPNNDFRIRKVTLSMSVTGQSSGTGDYPATLEIYQGLTGAGGLRYTGIPVATPAGNVIQLAGDNGNAQDVVFQMTPAAGSSVAINGQDLLFVLKITAPSNRTLQLWYNSKASSAGICPSSMLYLPGVIPPASGRNVLKGHLIRVSN